MLAQKRNARGISHLITVAYNHYTVDACDLAKQVKAAHRDYVWAISYLNDSVSILQALAAHQVHVASGGGASVLNLRWLNAVGRFPNRCDNMVSVT